MFVMKLRNICVYFFEFNLSFLRIHETAFQLTMIKKTFNLNRFRDVLKTLGRWLVGVDFWLVALGFSL